jgi:gluconolactonase
MDRREFVGSLAAAAALWPLPARAARPKAGAFRTILRDLERPEGIACARDGRTFISTASAAYVVLGADAALTRVGENVHGNGVALDGRGRVVIATFGLLANKPGPLLRHDPVTDRFETLADKMGGRLLVGSNAPAIARDGTIYCTHSKWSDPANIGNRTAEGFVYRVTPAGEVTMETSGIRGANGCCLDRGERHLYVAETASGRIRRMRRRRDGSLGRAENFGPLLGEVIPDHDIGDIRRMDAAARGRLGYPDGLAFDAQGNLWVTLPFANTIVAITPDQRVIEMARDPAGETISMPTNIAWGGADLRDLYVVSRASNSIARARTTVAGLPLSHWVQRPASKARRIA